MKVYVVVEHNQTPSRVEVLDVFLNEIEALEFRKEEQNERISRWSLSRVFVVEKTVR